MTLMGKNITLVIGILFGKGCYRSVMTVLHVGFVLEHSMVPDTSDTSEPCLID